MTWLMLFYFLFFRFHTTLSHLMQVEICFNVCSAWDLLKIITPKTRQRAAKSNPNLISPCAELRQQVRMSFLLSLFQARISPSKNSRTFFKSEMQFLKHFFSTVQCQRSLKVHDILCQFILMNCLNRLLVIVKLL